MLSVPHCVTLPILKPCEPGEFRRAACTLANPLEHRDGLLVRRRRIVDPEAVPMHIQPIGHLPCCAVRRYARVCRTLRARARNECVAARVRGRWRDGLWERDSWHTVACQLHLASEPIMPDQRLAVGHERSRRLRAELPLRDVALVRQLRRQR